MLKRLNITYGELVLFDEDVNDFEWKDSDGFVAVNAKLPAPKTAAGNGLADLLSGLSKQKTQAVVERKREEYDDCS